MNTTQNNLYKIKTKKQICLNKKLKVGYRALRWDEDTDDGIYAKDLTSLVSLEEHIRQGEKDSPWISTTTDLTVAQVWAMRNLSDVAVIAYPAMEGCEIIDVRKGLPSLDRLSNNLAKSSREVCVKYHIPKEAMLMVVSYPEIREMCTVDYTSKSAYTESYEMLLRWLEGNTNNTEIWENNFAKIVEHSQMLWTRNRQYKNPLKVEF